MLFYRVAFVLMSVGTILASRPSKPYYDLKDAEQLFSDFIDKYGKEYESIEEHNKRFEFFKRKLSLINHWNEVHDSLFVINEFTDKGPSERLNGYVRPSKRKLLKSVSIPDEWIENAPESLDYRLQRLVTEVKHQSCDDCYIFSAVGNIEGQYAKLTGQLISLSEQQALDCVGNHPCSVYGGNPVEVMQKLAAREGLVSEQDYPYMGHGEQQCQNPDKSEVKVKVTDGYRIDIQDEEALKGALAQLGPLSIGIHATENMGQWHSNGEIYDSYDCDGQQPNHAVLLVGYSADANGTPYWIIKNSWGAQWGNNGYLLLERGKNRCSILAEGAFNARVASP